MNISYLHLENFKRFTDLTIDLSKLDQPPKLVLLIGANGSGKSSVFDAFERISFMSKDGRSF
ncbi:MAG: AAA family ATPase, partial [Cyclobacteriaceae bacterium]